MRGVRLPDLEESDMKQTERKNERRKTAGARFKLTQKTDNLLFGNGRHGTKTGEKLL